jgi:hypothetical protein
MRMVLSKNEKGHHPSLWMMAFEFASIRLPSSRRLVSDDHSDKKPDQNHGNDDTDPPPGRWTGPGQLAALSTLSAATCP